MSYLRDTLKKTGWLLSIIIERIGCYMLGYKSFTCNNFLIVVFIAKQALNFLLFLLHHDLIFKNLYIYVLLLSIWWCFLYLVLGTPGTGKSTLAQELSNMTCLSFVNVGQLAKENGFFAGFDDQLECPILDEDQVIGN